MIYAPSASKENHDNAKQTGESGLDWLLWGMDVTDQARGYLRIDKDSADCKDIDDGATVAGAADELKEATGMIEDLVKEISFKEDVAEELRRDISVKTDENESLRQRIALLEAQNAALTITQKPTVSSGKQTVDTPANKGSQQKKSKKKKKKQRAQSAHVSFEARSQAHRGGGSSADGP